MKGAYAMSSSTPESPSPVSARSTVERRIIARSPQDRWLTPARRGFLLAFAGGVVIALSLFLPNVSLTGITPSLWGLLNTPLCADEYPPCSAVICVSAHTSSAGTPCLVWFYQASLL